MIRTNEGGVQYEHSLDHHVEFFSKAGSAFSGKRSFYRNAESALSLFQKAWIVDKELAMKLLMWLRDCRGGAGNRSGARDIYRWLSNTEPDWLRVNLHLLPEVGRWDDLRSLFGTNLQLHAAKLWAGALASDNVLAAKWAKRTDFPLGKVLGLNQARLRKLLSRIRKEHIVEARMCSNKWNIIDYEHVPSVAMARYTNAFKCHDRARFEFYKESLKKGEAKVHADVLFPHDCVRTVMNGDTDIANAQFSALPNFLEETNERIIVISDTSGSMTVHVSGSVRAVDISQGLALYCSDKIGKDSPFYKKFIGFCSEGSFKDWNGMTFAQAVNSRHVFDGAVGSTRIDKALDLILKTAKFFNIADNNMPTTLLIVSDMQFHNGGAHPYNKAEVPKALDRWKDAGYALPKIVYWNTDSYVGTPETVATKDVALVSGFSPSILKAILGGTDFSPKAIMLRAVEKYNIQTV